MEDILTPTSARKTEDFTTTQKNLVRSSLGIGQPYLPYDPTKTYIVFNAVAGNNTLHIAFASVETYTISKGDSQLAVSFTDGGGDKIINYTEAGVYLITISGTFAGIDTVSSGGSGIEKYIEIICGTNYPTTIATSAFDGCVNLTHFSSESALTIGTDAFSFCTSLDKLEIPSVTSIVNNVFSGCTSLVNVYSPSMTSMGSSAFANCTSLVSVDLPAITSMGNSVFSGCTLLQYFKILYSAGLTIGASAFTNVNLSDLYPIGAGNGTNAAAVETKLTTAGMSQLNGYRLLY